MASRVSSTSDGEKAPDPVNTDNLELSLVGFMIMYPERIYDLEHLKPGHLMNPTVRRVFSAIKKIYNESGHAALTTSAAYMPELGRQGISEAEAMTILADARDRAPQHPGGITRVVEELINVAIRRSLAATADELLALADSTKSTDEISSDVAVLLTDSVKDAARDPIRSTEDLMEEAIKEMDSPTGQQMGLSTGLKGLDKIISGLHGGEMIVIGARPGVGKSSLAVHMATALGADQGVPGLIFTLEMRCKEYAQRLICGRAQLDIQKVRLGALHEIERKMYREAAEEFRDSNTIYVQDTGRITMPRLASATRRMYFEQGIRWVMIDYMQLMDHLQRSGESTNDAITRTSSTIKALAQNLDIPVVALAQLNRGLEQRDNKRPRLSDLRSSGSIEQDADVVLFLHRESMFKPADEQAQERSNPTEKAEIIVAKQRNGPMGTVAATFIKAHAGFADCDDSDSVGYEV